MKKPLVSELTSGILIGKMVGWGQLKEAVKPALMQGFVFDRTCLFPHLFPRFAFAT